MKKIIFFAACTLVFLAGCEKEATTVAVVVKTAPRKPIIAQAVLCSYGGGGLRYPQGFIGFEGKIYNPNAFGVIGVRVQWHVYVTPEDKKTAEFLRQGNYEESCGFEFAYIPPLTTYDFKTDKIVARTAEFMDGIGEGRRAGVMTDLKPEIVFTPEL